MKRKKKKEVWFYVGVGLVILSILVLAINIILGTVFKNELFRELVKSKEYKEATLKYGDSLIDEITNLLYFFCFMWAIIIVLSILALVTINKDIKNWFYFLLLGILSIFTFRFEVGIFFFISSFIFWIEKRKNENKRH